MMGLPRSTYYSALKSSPEIQEQKDLALKDQIEQVRLTFPCYGYRKLYQHFLREGLRINDKRIRRVVRKYGLFPIFWGKKFKVQTTQSDHNLPVFPNLLKGMKETAVNQVWVADITYIRILTCFVYLAAILDRFSRKVIGWAISKRLDRELSLQALKMALEERNPPPGCIHHSDRGVQYACWDYVVLLESKGLRISMSRRGNPYDNAHAESFFKTLKYEEVHLFNYETFEEVLQRLPYFIKEVYNKKRLHSSIGYLPPEEFERHAASGPLTEIAVKPILFLE
jgi:transposase InsO family protein